MSSKSVKSPSKATLVRPADDLELELYKAARKRRVLSWIVLGLLLVAFVVTSALQMMPLLSRPNDASNSAAAQPPRTIKAQIAELETLTRQHPEDVDMIVALGNLQYDDKAYGAAIVTYRKALKLEPGDADVRVDYGTCLYYQHQPLEAIAAFRKVLETHPRHLNALVNMGVVYNSLGQEEKAAEAWHTAYALATDPAIKTKIKNMLEAIMTTGDQNQ